MPRISHRESGKTGLPKASKTWSTSGLKWQNERGLVGLCIKYDEICIKDYEFFIKDDEIGIKNDELCIKNDELCIQNIEFCI